MWMSAAPISPHGISSAKTVTDLPALRVDPLGVLEAARDGGAIPPATRGRIHRGLPLRDRMRRKPQTKRGRWRSALRMEMVEPVFDQIKRGWGFWQFALRSLGKINAPKIASRPVGNLLNWPPDSNQTKRRVWIMTSDQKEPSNKGLSDDDRFHFAVHDGNADDCPECQCSTNPSARHAPLNELEELAIRAECLAPFVSSDGAYDGDYQENLPGFIEAAVAYGNAISKWRLIWEYGTHTCPGINCHYCEWRLGPPTWDPVELECEIHPNCTFHTMQPCWTGKTWADILKYLALHDRPLPTHLIARHERKPFNQDAE